MMMPLLALTGILAASGPGIEIATISIHKNRCTAEKVKVTTVKKADRDILVWGIENKCPRALNVLLCVDPTPPLTCLGDPEEAKLGATFEMGAAKTDKALQFIACTVKWPPAKKTFRLDVISGPTGTPLSCPPYIPETYELALEVVP